MRNWKVLERILWAAAVVAIVIVMSNAAGCTGDWPLRWKPTEQQKQASDLVVKDLHAIGPHVEPLGEPIRLEALAGAETTQQYMGLPEKRPMPVAPENPGILAQAQADASRPRPTVMDAAREGVEEVSRVTEAAFPLVDQLLTIAATVAGVWGLGRGRQYVTNLKTKASEAEGQVGATVEAMRQTVGAVDEFLATTKPEQKAALKAVLGERQDKAAKMLVRELQD